jgi:hypothetical protein
MNITTKQNYWMDNKLVSFVRTRLQQIDKKVGEDALKSRRFSGLQYANELKLNL